MSNRKTLSAAVRFDNCINVQATRITTYGYDHAVLATNSENVTTSEIKAYDRPAERQPRRNAPRKYVRGFRPKKTKKTSGLVSRLAEQLAAGVSVQAIVRSLGW